MTTLRKLQVKFMKTNVINRKKSGGLAWFPRSKTSERRNKKTAPNKTGVGGSGAESNHPSTVLHCDDYPSRVITPQAIEEYA